MTLKYRMFSSDGDALIPGAEKRKKNGIKQHARETETNAAAAADSELHQNSERTRAKLVRHLVR